MLLLVTPPPLDTSSPERERKKKVLKEIFNEGFWQLRKIMSCLVQLPNQYRSEKMKKKNVHTKRKNNFWVLLVPHILYVRLWLFVCPFYIDLAFFSHYLQSVMWTIVVQVMSFYVILEFFIIYLSIPRNL